MKSKFGYIIDNITTILVIFLLVFVWVRRYLHNTFIILLTSFFATLVISFLVMVFFDKKREKQIIKNTDQKNIKLIANSLVLMTKKEVLEYLQKALKDYFPQTKNDFVIIKKDDIFYAIFPIFKARKIEIQDYVLIYKKYKNSKFKIVVLGEEENINCYDFRNNLKKQISFVSLSKFYFSYLKKMEVLKPPFKEIKRKKLNDILCIFLSKKQSKKYFLLTIFFCLYSFLFRYSLYYLVCGIILGILTIISLKNKRFNKQNFSYMF